MNTKKRLPIPFSHLIPGVIYYEDRWSEYKGAFKDGDELCGYDYVCDSIDGNSGIPGHTCVDMIVYIEVECVSV